jgi:hypothetical protein
VCLLVSKISVQVFCLFKIQGLLLFVFWFMIHFKLIFVCSVRSRWRFLILLNFFWVGVLLCSPGWP